jgi:Predicted Zn-dependent proteases and their inactivated homologs
MDLIKTNFDKISARAASDGARLELMVSGGEILKLGYQKKVLQTFESKQTAVAGFRVILGASQGYAYTENLSLEALERAYVEALNNAKTLKSDEAFEIPLARPAAVPSFSGLNIQEEISMEDKKAAALALEQSCYAKDARVQNVPYSGFVEGKSSVRILNSEGLDQNFEQSYFTGYASPLVKENEFTKADGGRFFARSFKDVNPEAAALRAVRRSVEKLGAGKLTTGNYAVVIDREAVSTFMSMLSDNLSAREVHDSKSILKGKLGQAVGSDKLTLIDDPLDVRGTSVRPFDSEGVPSQKTVLFEKGVLKHYLTNLEYAKRMNLPHTASAARGPRSSSDMGPSNLVIQLGSTSFADMVKSHDKVIHLTKVTGGLHAGYNDATGDFSLPGEAVLYVNGERQGPVDQFVFSGNILDVLRDIEAVGNEYNFDEASSVISPHLLIKSLSFAGA